jgi:hypothetical protein
LWYFKFLDFFTSWLVPIFLLEYYWNTNRKCCLLFNLSFKLNSLSVIYRHHNLWTLFKGPFFLVSLIVFWFKEHALFYFSTIRRSLFINVSHWIFHDNRRINISADVSNLKVEFCFSWCVWCLYWHVLGIPFYSILY